MPQDSPRSDPPAPARPGAVPVPPTARQDAAAGRRPAPDLHIEEIEERHIPKDRNIFDK